MPGSRTIYAAGSQGIFKSYDRAENWIEVTGDSLTQPFIFSGGITVSKKDTNTVIAGAMHRLIPGGSLITGGIFISHSSGKDWYQHNMGVPDGVLVGSIHLFLDQSTNTLYSNKTLINKVDQYHLYRLDLDELIGTGTSSNESGNLELPESVELLQNYPNPFNSNTVIRYQLPKTRDVRLEVYDMLGRKVAVLVDEVQQPGSHLIIWNATNVPSGTYFYRLHAGDEIRSRAMTLIR